MNAEVQPVTLESMTDEEVLNTNPDTLVAETVSDEEVQTEVDTTNEPDAGEESETTTEEVEASDTETEETVNPELADVYYSKNDSTEEDPELEATVEDTESEQAETLDSDAELQELFKPFKAAKREIKVDNVADARRLMQKGVDYARKMEAMKPYRKALKTLERNGLLEEDQINFMVDLVQKKNPEAIKKFLKDSQVDPLDLDLEEGTAYSPTDYGLDDEEMALEEVLDDIRETPHFQQTVDEITNKFDMKSKQVLLREPHILRALNDHIGVGIYGQVMNVVEQERVLGRLEGLSDLEAYKAVGDAINAKGGFKPYQRQESAPAQSTQVSGSGSSRRDEQLRKRKAAASPTHGTGGKSKEVKNFLSSYTDEEIEKMAPPIL